MLKITVCDTEYDLSELDYYELNDLWLEFVDCADSLSEHSHSYHGIGNSNCYEQVLEEYRAGIAAIQRRMEELEQEAAAQVAISSSNYALLQSHAHLPESSCWWFGCKVLVESDEAYCEKHRLLSVENKDGTKT